MPTSAPRFRPEYVDLERAPARPSRSRIYGRRWQKFRLWYLGQHPLCEEQDCGRPAEVVDHRRPHLGDLVLVFDPENCRSLCKRCHDRKTAGQDGGFGNPVRNPLLVRQ